MAEEKKSLYPMLPVAHWWTLRDKFKQSIPGVMTDSYLAASLNIKPENARANIMPYLKAIGLIDEEGKTKDFAKEWRDDEQYANVCKKIRDKIYPSELIAAVADPLKDRKAVERWFASETGNGVSAVKRMAAFYIVLSEANATRKPEKKTAKEQTGIKQKPVVKKEEPQKTSTKVGREPVKDDKAGETSPPSVHINLEIHISADATPDQIDKIFESMARHIYKK